MQFLSTKFNECYITLDIIDSSFTTPTMYQGRCVNSIGYIFNWEETIPEWNLIIGPQPVYPPAIIPGVDLEEIDEPIPLEDLICDGVCPIDVSIEYEYSLLDDFIVLVSSGEVISNTIPISGLDSETSYYLRVRYKYVDSLGNITRTAWSNTYIMATAANLISTPDVTILGKDPINPTYPIESGPLEINASPFLISGSTETHESTDWEISEDINFNTFVYQNLNDNLNLEDITINGLTPGRTYYVRVRYNSLSYSSGYGNDNATIALYNLDLLHIDNPTNDNQTVNYTVTHDGGQVFTEGTLVVHITTGSIDILGYSFNWIIPDLSQDEYCSFEIYIENINHEKLSTVFTDTVLINDVNLGNDDIAILVRGADREINIPFSNRTISKTVVPLAQDQSDNFWGRHQFKANVPEAPIISSTGPDYKVFGTYDVGTKVLAYDGTSYFMDEILAITDENNFTEMLGISNMYAPTADIEWLKNVSLVDGGTVFSWYDPGVNYQKFQVFDKNGSPETGIINTELSSPYMDFYGMNSLADDTFILGLETTTDVYLQKYGRDGTLIKITPLDHPTDENYAYDDFRKAAFDIYKKDNSIYVIALWVEESSGESYEKHRVYKYDSDLNLMNYADNTPPAQELDEKGFINAVDQNTGYFMYVNSGGTGWHDDTYLHVYDQNLIIKHSIFLADHQRTVDNYALKTMNNGKVYLAAEYMWGGDPHMGLGIIDPIQGTIVDTVRMSTDNLDWGNIHDYNGRVLLTGQDQDSNGHAAYTIYDYDLNLIVGKTDMDNNSLKNSSITADLSQNGILTYFFQRDDDKVIFKKSAVRNTMTLGTSGYTHIYPIAQDVYLTNAKEDMTSLVDIRPEFITRNSDTSVSIIAPLSVQPGDYTLMFSENFSEDITLNVGDIVEETADGIIYGCDTSIAMESSGKDSIKTVKQSNGNLITTYINEESIGKLIKVAPNSAALWEISSESVMDNISVDVLNDDSIVILYIKLGAIYVQKFDTHGNILIPETELVPSPGSGILNSIYLTSLGNDTLAVTYEHQGAANTIILDASLQIIYGTQTYISTGFGEDSYVAAFDDGKFVIAYSDISGSINGTFIIINYDNTLYKDKSVFSTTTCTGLSVDTLSNGNFVVAYVDEENNAKVSCYHILTQGGVNIKSRTEIIGVRDTVDTNVATSVDDDIWIAVKYLVLSGGEVYSQESYIAIVDSTGNSLDGSDLGIPQLPIKGSVGYSNTSLVSLDNGKMLLTFPKNISRTIGNKCLAYRAQHKNIINITTSGTLPDEDKVKNALVLTNIPREDLSTFTTIVETAGHAEITFPKVLETGRSLDYIIRGRTNCILRPINIGLDKDQ